MTDTVTAAQSLTRPTATVEKIEAVRGIDLEARRYEMFGKFAW